MLKIGDQFNGKKMSTKSSLQIPHPGSQMTHQSQNSIYNNIKDSHKSQNQSKKQGSLTIKDMAKIERKQQIEEEKAILKGMI